MQPRKDHNAANVFGQRNTPIKMKNYRNEERVLFKFLYFNLQLVFESNVCFDFFVDIGTLERESSVNLLAMKIVIILSQNNT